MFVVTGGGSGIGRGLAQALAARNKQVLIVGRREDLLHETAASSSLISICCADISTHEGRQVLITQLQTVQHLEGLIHNAGIIPIGSINTIPEASWQQALAVNLNAPLFLNQLLLHKLVRARVLTLGTAVAYFPVAGLSAYCVSKAAAAMLTKCWQLECPQTAFASVMPGIINTDMQTLIRESECLEPTQRAFYENLYRENRLLTPEVVGLFLTWILLDVEKKVYVSQEWDIYDKTHHSMWLTAPHSVPHWE